MSYNEGLLTREKPLPQEVKAGSAVQDMEADISLERLLIVAQSSGDYVAVARYRLEMAIERASQYWNPISPEDLQDWLAHFPHQKEWHEYVSNCRPPDKFMLEVGEATKSGFLDGYELWYSKPEERLLLIGRVTRKVADKDVSRYFMMGRIGDDARGLMEITNERLRANGRKLLIRQTRTFGLPALTLLVVAFVAWMIAPSLGSVSKAMHPAIPYGPHAIASALFHLCSYLAYFVAILSTGLAAGMLLLGTVAVLMKINLAGMVSKLSNTLSQ